MAGLYGLAGRHDCTWPNVVATVCDQRSTDRVNIRNMDGSESARQTHVVETALTVFVRHGFRKTSIEDIAKAAGISRQGIYLHFKNKDEIFSASIQKALHDGLQAANRILDDDGLTLEKKLLNALDEWFGCATQSTCAVEICKIAPARGRSFRTCALFDRIVGRLSHRR
jgi:AcrR family transcriptional regulator